MAFPLPCAVEHEETQDNKAIFFISGKGWDLPLGKGLQAVNTNSGRIAADCAGRARSVIKGRLTRFGFVLTIRATARGRNLIYPFRNTVGLHRLSKFLPQAAVFRSQ